MDWQPHFFSDSVDLGEDSDLYVASPAGGAEYGADFQQFPLFTAKDDIGDWQSSTGRKRPAVEFDIWDGLSQGAGFQTEPEQQPLFVNPGLCAEKQGRADDDVSVEYGSRPSTRRTSSIKSVSASTTKSTSAATDLTAPEGPELPRKKRSRKAAKKEGAASPEEETKRTKFLERNRVAASKCREKKKTFIANLNDKKVDLETQHTHLFAEYDRLREEANELRQHLISHAKCNDPNIDSWLNSEARRFAQIQQSSQAPEQLFDPTFAATAAIFDGSTMASQPPTHHPAHSRNPSTASTYASGMPHTASPLDISPTDAVFPALASPQLKREPGINYDHMPDSLFAADRPCFGVT